MAYEIMPELGERVEASIVLSLSEKAQPFYFSVTNQAVYIPRVKLIAKTDPYYFERVPLHKINRVAVKRLRPYGLWVLAGLMIIVGLATSIWMMEPVLKKEPGRHTVSGWPFAILVGGILLPVAAHGRFGLEIEFEGGKYRWKPPLVIDKPSKQKITETLETIMDACKKGGISISDQRSK